MSPQSPAPKKPEAPPPPEPEQALVAEEQHASLEQEADAEVEASAARVREFRSTVEQKIESLGAPIFFDAVENFEELADGAMEKALENPETKERFLKGLQAAAKRCGPELRKVFNSWLSENLDDEDSRLSHLYGEWATRDALAGTAERVNSQINMLGLSGKLEQNGCLSKVVSRIRSLEDRFKQVAQRPVMPTEEVFTEFLITRAWERWQADEERQPTMWERVRGKTKRKPKEFFQQIVNDELDPNYALRTDQAGLNNKDRILTQASDKKLTPTANGKRPRFKADATDTAGTILKNTVKLNGEVMAGEHLENQLIGEVKTEDWEEYARKTDLPPEFLQSLEALAPILGRRGLVSRVNFVPGAGPNGSENGSFSPTERSVNMYFNGPRTRTEYAKTLAHEAGHAMRPEETLPLREAVALSMELVASVQRTGFVSAYSQQAKQYYMSGYRGPVIYMEERIKEFFNDANLIEEWAEMVGYGMTPSGLEHIFPEKFDMVRRYLQKLGLDLDRARSMIADSVTPKRESEEMETVSVPGYKLPQLTEGEPT